MPVAATFDFRDSDGNSLSDVARIDTMVTVVDAANLLADFTSEELLAQRGLVAAGGDERSLAGLLTEKMEFADVVVISKQDLVSPEQLDRVIGAVKALNPTADIVCAQHGRVPLAKVLGTGKFNLERASQMSGWARELAGLHASETAAFGIDSFVMRFREPLHPERFAEFLSQGFPGLLRAKGYVWLASRPDWAVTYSRAGNVATIGPVGHWWVAAPRSDWPRAATLQRQNIEATWREPYGDRINEVVFIGLGIDREALEPAFLACQLTAAELGKGVRNWQSLPDPFPDWVRDEALADTSEAATT